jgi:hypothetical protein
MKHFWVIDKVPVTEFNSEEEAQNLLDIYTKDGMVHLNIWKGGKQIDDRTVPLESISIMSKEEFDSLEDSTNSEDS